MINEKILVVGPAWIGDMVLAQSLFKLLKQQRPDRQIDVIAPLWVAALLPHMSEVTKIFPVSLRHGPLQLQERWQLGKQLRQTHYTQAIVLPDTWKAAIIPFVAKIPLRTGWLGEWRYGLLNDWRYLNKELYPSMVKRYLALGWPATAKTPLDWQSHQPRLMIHKIVIKNILKKLVCTITDQPILALCPGAAFGETKRWPTDHFAAVANKKLAEGWQVWLFGANKEQALGETIAQLTNHRCVNWIAKVSLSEAINLLSLAKVVIANDSGLLHVAAALQRPVVAIYGSTQPSFAPPLTEQVKIQYLNLSCSPCGQRQCPLTHYNCLRHITPSSVLEAVDDLYHLASYTNIAPLMSQ